LCRVSSPVLLGPNLSRAGHRHTPRLPSDTLRFQFLYYALVLPALDYTISVEEPGYRKASTWFALIFVGPALFGLLLGLNAQFGLARRILQWCCLNPVHVMATAWDWKFSTMKEQWVLVVLKDGTKFGGFCGRNSFISSDSKERDLYIERVYDLDDQNNWHPRDNGVLIAAGEIRTIEFWPTHTGDRSNERTTCDASHPAGSDPGAQGLPAATEYHGADA
jgi:hypothetical protein